jgi:hypothetical protein
MGNLCARIPNAVPKAQASPAFPQIRHYDKNAWPTQASFSHTSAVPICPNYTEQVSRLIDRAPGRQAPTILGVCGGLGHTVVDVLW